eukprot:TRINITY_DN16801_c0_g1_i3.p1 TRINITY_DN16801_c0_g1~~TRINITY_DN16801_c0_g1_i3.p1  ORF type:complete len:227 (+),score=15.65 TRINITY_DN16801_c0_g1_i3:43-723(+)
MSLIKSTSIYRLGDGLLLCASNNGKRDQDAARAHEQKVFEHVRRQYMGGALGRHTELEGGEASFYILNDGNVGYITCCGRGAVKEAVHGFLEDIRREFHDMFSMHEITAARRQYELINFDKLIQKVVRRFDATGGNPQVVALKKELAEVTNIMKQNLEDVIGRGEKLDDLHSQSDKLRRESHRYYTKTQKLSRMQLFRKYAPKVSVGLALFAFIWWKLGFSFLFFL